MRYGGSQVEPLADGEDLYGPVEAELGFFYATLHRSFFWARDFTCDLVQSKLPGEAVGNWETCDRGIAEQQREKESLDEGACRPCSRLASHG